MATPFNDIIQDETAAYLNDHVDPDNPPTSSTIEQELLDKVNDMIEVENVGRPKKNQLPFLKTLTHGQIAMILRHLHNFCRIAPSASNADPDADPLGMYMDEGPEAGIYVTSEDTFRAVARKYNFSLTINEFKEVLAALKDGAPRRYRSIERDAIPVNNGIFNFRTKQLEPFTPDRVFIAKSRVDYVPDASPVSITMVDGTVWDFDSWLLDLMGDDESMATLIWEIMSAVVRPFVSWRKSAWFYSTSGNSGKGTLVQVMRDLVGEGSYASIKLSDFGKDFLLEPLLRAQAILVDENDVGIWIDQAANLKAVQTNDVIPVNRKHRPVVSAQFFGFMVQCLNEFPRVKDKSESFYRRQHPVPFEKCFTGTEIPEIKDDYLRRPEVLQYILNRVLHMEHYQLSTPAPVAEAIEQYKLHNDPTRAFWAEMEPQFVWDLLPNTFLYELFKAWSLKNNPKGSVTGKQTFLDGIKELALATGRWSWTPKSRTKGSMDGPELLIDEYDLQSWMNPMGKGSNDPNRRCSPIAKLMDTGLLRTGPRLVVVDDEAPDDEDVLDEGATA